MTTRSVGQGRADGAFATGHKGKRAATTWRPGTTPRHLRRAFHREARRSSLATPPMRKWGNWRMTGDAYVPDEVVYPLRIVPKADDRRATIAARAAAWRHGCKPHPSLAPLAALRRLWAARDEAQRNIRTMERMAGVRLSPDRNQPEAA